jgi:hypothetical protein
LHEVTGEVLVYPCLAGHLGVVPYHLLRDHEVSKFLSELVDGFEDFSEELHLLHLFEGVLVTVLIEFVDLLGIHDQPLVLFVICMAEMGETGCVFLLDDVFHLLDLNGKPG